MNNCMYVIIIIIIVACVFMRLFHYMFVMCFVVLGVYVVFLSMCIICLCHTMNAFYCVSLLVQVCDVFMLFVCVPLVCCVL